MTKTAQNTKPEPKTKRRRKPRPIRGEMLDKYDEPNWDPLLRLARVYIEEFMWMFAVELEDGTELQAYKHYWTRRYIHLDDKGRAFYFIWKPIYDVGKGKDEPSEYMEIPEDELTRFFDQVIERPDLARGIPRYIYHDEESKWRAEGDGFDAR